MAGRSLLLRVVSCCFVGDASDVVNCPPRCDSSDWRRRRQSINSSACVRRRVRGLSSVCCLPSDLGRLDVCSAAPDWCLRLPIFSILLRVRNQLAKAHEKRIPQLSPLSGLVEVKLKFSAWRALVKSSMLGTIPSQAEEEWVCCSTNPGPDWPRYSVSIRLGMFSTSRQQRLAAE